MAKSSSRKTAASAAKPSERAPSPQALRSKIDRLDRELLRLMSERAEAYVQWAGGPQSGGSQAEGSPVASFVEEEAALERLVEANPGPLSARAVRGAFRELFSGARSLVRGLRIACLGPEYSYSHLAAMEHYGRSVEYALVATIAAVFEEVQCKHSDFGIVPIENSTDGRVADTLDMFTRMPLRICGEVELAVHHTLLAANARSEITAVYSKPQALSQCRNWLAKHLPNAALVEMTSTTAAARLALEKPGAAAVASVQAGIHHGLSIVAECIEDNPGNTTRFVVIGHEPAPRSGCDKTAVMFELEHRPGSLAETINVFKRHRLNLTWIESFPIVGSKRTYLFFMEMEGHATDLRVRKALASLERKTRRLEVLGSFPVQPSPVADGARRM